LGDSLNPGLNCTWEIGDLAGCGLLA